MATKPAVKSTAVKSTTDVNMVRKFLKAAIERKYGTMTAYAEKAECSLQYVSNVLGGNKAIPDWMLKHFGVKHVVLEHWEVKAS